MNPIGKILCPGCRKIIKAKDVVWRDSENQVTFSLKKKGTTYTAGEPRFLGSIPQTATIKIEKVERQSFLPSVIHLNYAWDTNGGRKEKNTILISSNRICPYCAREGKVQNLTDGSGYYPTINIALIGTPGTGKSTFLRSFNTIENCRKMTSFLVTDEMENYEAQASDVEKKQDVTKLMDRNIKTFVISRRGKKKYLVCFHDLAGEFSDSSNMTKSEFARTIQFVRKNVDGILRVFDPRYCNCSDFDDYKRDKNSVLTGDANWLLAQCTDYGADIPSAIVITGADDVKRVAVEQGGIHNQAGQVIMTTESPIFYEVTDLTDEQLYRHMYLVRDFINEVTNIKIRDNVDSEGYFMVSSGEITGIQQFDYRRGSNVPLPVVWLFNRIGLAKVKKGECA